MKPVFVLISVFVLSLLARAVFVKEWNYVLAGNIAMGAMMIFTSVAHFAFAKGMVMMMPSFLPMKQFLVYITGLMEALLGIGLVMSSTRYYAAIALIIFFILVLPANIMAAKRKVNIEKADYTGPGLSYLKFRIPLQLFFIAWVWYFGIR